MELPDNIVNRIKEIVGKEHVSIARPIRYGYVARGIMENWSNPPALVARPASVDEIIKILELANKEKIPVIPQAGGLSGGEATPVEEGGILLDLRRMDKIIEVDTNSRYMLVEPGVTSAQAWRYMQDNYPEYRPGIPDGAPPAATIIGDHLDKGFHFMATRYGPAADDVLGVEVVLPTGELVRTGSAALPTAKWFYRWSFGPDLTGIFLGSQGTLGIITKMAVKIFPMPKFRDVVAYGANGWDYLVEPTLEVLKTECIDLAQGGNYHLATTRRALYKWPPQERPSFLPPLWMNFELGAETQEELAITKRKIFKILERYQEKYGKDNIFEWKLDKMNIVARLTKPNRISVPYAGHKGGGLLFITWYIPWDEAAEFGKIAEDLMEKYKISPVVWLAAVDHGRQGLLMPIVLFDPKSEKEFEKVDELDKEMTDRFLEMGGIPYRPNVKIHAPKVMEKAKGYYQFLKKIKNLLDPNRIMHPGRLAIP